MSRHLLMVFGAGLSVAFFAACGSGDADSGGAAGDDGSSPSATAPPHDADAAPDLGEPASQYSILQSDLDGDFLTDIEGTFVLGVDNYGASNTFESPDEGAAQLEDWGYVGGYETGYTPDGYENAVLNGSVYFWAETHLFEDEGGAQSAFEYINERLDDSVSSRAEAHPVGNESVAWEAQGDYVPGSSVRSVFHRVVFRRGNLVGVIATWGAESLVNPNEAARLARIIDEKALGERDLEEPTPISGNTSFSGQDEGD